VLRPVAVMPRDVVEHGDANAMIRRLFMSRRVLAVEINSYSDLGRFPKVGSVISVAAGTLSSA
jgi:hypothetical protein